MNTTVCMRFSALELSACRLSLFVSLIEGGSIGLSKWSLKSSLLRL